jgi:chromosomal replication initiation ATPase DnaA
MQQQICRSSAAAWAGVPAAALLRPERNAAAVVQARHTAIYLAHVVLACSLTRAGAMVGRDRTTARHACLRIEERREDRRIDRALDALEAALQTWLRTFAKGDA